MNPGDQCISLAFAYNGKYLKTVNILDIYSFKHVILRQVGHLENVHCNAQCNFAVFVNSLSCLEFMPTVIFVP